MSGLTQLLQSRRALTALVDLVVSVVLYFGGKYFAADLDTIKFMIGVFQVPALMVIAAYTVNDMHSNALDTQLEMHKASLDNQLTLHQATLDALPPPPAPAVATVTTSSSAKGGK